MYSFTAGTDGAVPYGGLVRDPQGNLYGTTTAGGTTNCAGPGCGIAFKVSAGGRETVLHRFTNGADGGIPFDTLIRDANGNLYGTTNAGGKVLSGGTVFKIYKMGRETVLYNFTGGSDGQGPDGSVVEDAAGNLYGTTEFGGGTHCDFGCGTVFELHSAGGETVLYRFTGKQDGAYPFAGVVMDSAGYLYGTDTERGDRGCRNVGCGVVFKLKP